MNLLFIKLYYAAQACRGKRVAIHTYRFGRVLLGLTDVVVV